MEVSIGVKKRGDFNRGHKGGLKVKMRGVKG